MTVKPASHEHGFRREYSTLEDMPRYNHPRHQQRITKLVKDQKLTTAGVQWSTFVETTSTPTSKSSNYIATQATTISWPGLEGYNVDEMEAGLTGSFMSTKGTSGTTIAFRWEIKDDDETTWTAISTFKKIAGGTSTGVERTVSGSVSLGAGYKKLPLLIRMRAYARTTHGKIRIKSSSYVAIKAKKQ